MANIATWVEKFGISEALHSEWLKQSQGQRGSFLAWCLQSGNLNEAAYLQWASNTYFLPLATSAFFRLPSVDQTWATARFLYQWTAELLPLEEWDGVLRIGCLEPPANFKFELPHCLVLVPASSMQKVWSKFFPMLPTPLEVAGTPTQTSPPVLSADEMLRKWQEEGFDPGAHAESVSEGNETAEDNAEKAEGLPDGFIGMASAAATDIPVPVLKKSVEPASTDSIAPSPISVASQPVASVAAQVAQMMAPSMPRIEPEQVVARDAPVTAEPSNLQPSSSEVAAFRKDVLEFESCENFEEIAHCAFNKMVKHFQYQMVLLFQAGALKPWMWSGSFVPANATKPTAIDLEKPSMFRIAVRTLLPYHGFTKSSEVNDAFFRDWNSGGAFQHVTITPLVIAGQVAGLFFGGTTREIESRVALADMERWAAEGARAFARIRDRNPVGVAA